MCVCREGGGQKRFTYFKRGGGGITCFTLWPVLMGGGGAQQVSYPRFTHFIA